MKKVFKAACWTLAFLMTFMGGVIFLRKLQIKYPLDGEESEEETED